MPKEHAEFDFDEFEGFTPAACKFLVDGETVFIPQSVVHCDSMSYLQDYMEESGNGPGGSDTIEVELWWLEKNGHV